MKNNVSYASTNATIYPRISIICYDLTALTLAFFLRTLLSLAVIFIFARLDTARRASENELQFSPHIFLSNIARVVNQKTLLESYAKERTTVKRRMKSAISAATPSRRRVIRIVLLGT